jgi:hypothetical protein
VLSISCREVRRIGGKNYITLIFILLYARGARRPWPMPPLSRSLIIQYFGIPMSVRKTTEKSEKNSQSQKNEKTR